MCGIVGAFKRKAGADLQTGRASPGGCSAPSGTGDPTSSATGARPTGTAGWRRRASRSSTWPRATSRCRTRTARSGSPFNGQIYNHVELHRELAALGHTFRTHCDTEVLVHGYEAWGGPGLLQRLRGMYAFAIYDMKRRRLFAARDRSASSRSSGGRTAPSSCSRAR
jgi:hypothetical protein